MAADFNPVQAQYIHWRSNNAFQVEEILCYEERRIDHTDLDSSSAGHDDNIAHNSHITYSNDDLNNSCTTRDYHKMDYHPVDKSIARLVLIGPNNSVDLYDPSEMRYVRMAGGSGAD